MIDETQERKWMQPRVNSREANAGIHPLGHSRMGLTFRLDASGAKLAERPSIKQVPISATAEARVSIKEHGCVKKWLDPTPSEVGR